MPEPLPVRVRELIRENRLLVPGDRVGVAVSGGADSVALLRILLECRHDLGIIVCAVHFNHRIRGAASDADEQFVCELAHGCGIELHTGSDDTPAFAGEQKLSLEAAARHLRYEFFRALIRNKTINKVATAHTLDDQAETVLLRIIRGTGIAGLAGIHPVLDVLSSIGSQAGAIVRPLLRVRREEIEAYLRDLQQPWREDATNSELKYSRNRVRHLLLPLLEREFNPAVRERLSELAEIARGEESYWRQHLPSRGERLYVTQLAAQDSAVQRRRIRDAASAHGLALDFREVEAVRRMLDQGGPKTVALTGGFRAQFCRDSGNDTQAQITFSQPQSPAEGYQYRLSWPGEVEIPELGAIVRARLVPFGAGAAGTKAESPRENGVTQGYNVSQPLDPGKLSPELLIRNWRPGDRYWPAQTSCPKKIKELLLKKHITGGARSTWPVVVSAGEIVWVRGFPVPNASRATDYNETGVLIEFSDLR